MSQRGDGGHEAPGKQENYVSVRGKKLYPEMQPFVNRDKDLRSLPEAVTRR
jgi:hypothetical protein